MDKLKQFRDSIDEIDEKIVRLFCQRMLVIDEVAAYKKNKGMPIYDGVRESSLIARHTKSLSNDLRGDCASLLNSMLNISRERQLRKQNKSISEK